MIRFEHVNKSYLDTGHALQRINFSLDRGEMAFLTGHSGAGKSTLLKLCAIIERATSGRLIVDGYDVDEIKPKHVPFLRRKIGIIFQTPCLLLNQTILENVAMPLAICGYSQQDMFRRARAALDKVGLLNKERCYPRQLSGGQQQRVGIARAVVNKPDLLLADEPTGNLDPKLSEEIMHLFEQFNRVGVSVLIASHDLSLIAQLRHRIVTLKDGKLIHSGD